MTTLYQQAIVTEDHSVHIQDPQLPTGAEIGVVLIFDKASVPAQPVAFWDRVKEMAVDGLPSDYSSRFAEYLDSQGAG